MNHLQDKDYKKLYQKYKFKYLNLKNNSIKGGAHIGSTAANAISLIPDSVISQNVGEFRIEGEQSNCTYNAGAAIGIIQDNLAEIQANIGNLGTPEAQAFFNGLWQNILNDGRVAFQSNQNQMVDPNELYNDGNVIETESNIMDSDIGGPTVAQFIERLNQRQYVMINHGGETILIYRIDDNNYILVDTHVTTGFMLIIDLNNWLTRIYQQYSLANEAVAPAFAWFAPAPQ